MALYRLKETKNWNWILPTCDSFPLIYYHVEWTNPHVHPFIFIQNLDNELVIANTALQEDQRFSANPLMRLLHQEPTMRVLSQNDMCNLHAFPEVWQYRAQVTLESLQQYLERQCSPAGSAAEIGRKDPLGLLRKFLEKVIMLKKYFDFKNLTKTYKSCWH